MYQAAKSDSSLLFSFFYHKTLKQHKNPKVEEVIKSGVAVQKLKEFIDYYGGNGELVNDYTLLPQAQNVRVVLAKETGYVARIEAEEVGKATMVLGAGRETKEDNINQKTKCFPFVKAILNRTILSLINNISKDMTIIGIA